MFLDEAVVEFVSGKGGDGAATMHREKHVPRGGPNGADGGKGGDVVLVADRSKRTLYDFKLHPRFVAESGANAQGNKAGKHGKDVEVRVPVGTVVYLQEAAPSSRSNVQGEAADRGDESPIADLSADGMRFVICRGGRGGYGNLHFVSSVRQSPHFAERGEPGESATARLELKLLADIGLVGLPNAGKSTLISRISAAKPKIADYPFTTVVPNLGVVSVGEETFTVADMPGLIEGASEGHGLGHRFLKHVERCAALVHLVEAAPLDGTDPVENYRLVERELERYSPELAKKPRLLVLSKADTIPDSGPLSAALEGETGQKPYVVSAVVGTGLDTLLYAMLELVQARAAVPEVRVVKFQQPRHDEAEWDVRVEKGGYALVGKRLERMVAMTNLESDEGLRHLHRKLVRLGVIARLRDLGAEEGDTVRVGDVEFAFSGDA